MDESEEETTEGQMLVHVALVHLFKVLTTAGRVGLSKADFDVYETARERGQAGFTIARSDTPAAVVDDPDVWLELTTPPPGAAVVS